MFTSEVGRTKTLAEGAEAGLRHFQERRVKNGVRVRTARRETWYPVFLPRVLQSPIGLIE